MLESAKKTAVSVLRRIPVPARLKRFVRQQDGTSAVEFSLVALPFIALTFAIIETALVFFAGQVLEAATANAARLILTGQAQTQNMSATTFKTQICNQLSSLFDCSGGIYVDVKNYTNFASASTANPVNNGNFDTSQLAYSPGGPGSIVVLRIYYQWQIYVSLLNTSISDLNGSKRLLVATAAFRNEPYQ